MPPPMLHLTAVAQESQPRRCRRHTTCLAVLGCRQRLESPPGAHFTAGVVDPLVGGAQLLAHSFQPSLGGVISDAITGDKEKRTAAVDQGVRKYEQI